MRPSDFVIPVQGNARPCGGTICTMIATATKGGSAPASITARQVSPHTRSTADDRQRTGPRVPPPMARHCRRCGRQQRRTAPAAASRTLPVCHSHRARGHGASSGHGLHPVHARRARTCCSSSHTARCRHLPRCVALPAARRTRHRERKRPASTGRTTARIPPAIDTVLTHGPVAADANGSPSRILRALRLIVGRQS